MTRKEILECVALIVASVLFITLGGVLGYRIGERASGTHPVQAVPVVTPYDKPLCLSLYAKPDGEPDYMVKACPVVPR